MVIIEYIKMQWGVTISYQKAYHAMNIINEIKCGNVEDSYPILPGLSVELERTNPGSFVRVFRARDLRPKGDDTFVRMFWTFGPCIRSFNRTLRPLVLVDGTHLCGKYHGVLLIVCGVDGNNGLFPLAFEIVENENEDSWSWFFTLFKQKVMPSESYVITICSDHQKGLMQAIPEVLSQAHHNYCMRHLAANFYSEFKDVLLKRLFWRAVHTLRESVFKDTMEQIKARNENAHKWISAILKESWGSFYFTGDRYDVITTNRSECLNAVLKNARKLLIASLVEHTRWKTSDFFQKCRVYGDEWQTQLTNYAEKHIKLAKEESLQYMAYRAGLHVFEVRSVQIQDSVNLHLQTYSCRVFQTIGLPCRHVMAAIAITKEKNMYSLCKPCYKVDRYQQTYDKVLYPTLDRTQWQVPHKPFMQGIPPRPR
ncbi:protein FAR1-RELATED SEQUENCE 5-like [Tasmannia lanceolata]|uniref:protein FAR1-RELATED SEQUENCE 5-like n=1 Tax=Tasmannia lanceolata TaxID=3420 RepID=UPI004063657E